MNKITNTISDENLNNIIILVISFSLYLTGIFGLKEELDLNKQFLEKSQANLVKYGCNFNSNQNEFFQSKLFKMEQQLDKVSVFDTYLIYPYIQKLVFQKIDSEEILKPRFSSSIGSELYQQEEYSFNNLKKLIDRKWKENYLPSDFKEC